MLGEIPLEVGGELAVCAAQILQSLVCEGVLLTQVAIRRRIRALAAAPTRHFLLLLLGCLADPVAGMGGVAGGRVKP